VLCVAVFAKRLIAASKAKGYVRERILKKSCGNTFGSCNLITSKGRNTSDNAAIFCNQRCKAQSQNIASISSFIILTPMVATCSGTKTAPLQECRLRCLACLNARLEHIASYQKVIKQNVLLIIAMHWFLPPRLNGTLEQWRSRLPATTETTMWSNAVRVFLLQRKRQC